MKKKLAAIGAAIGLASAAHAAPGGPEYVLMAALMYDGVPLMTSTSLIRDSNGAAYPLVMESGKTIGYAECTKLPSGASLNSRQRFVGRRVQVDTKKSDGRSFDLLISAADTSLTAVTKTGAADCVSEAVNTTGLDVHDVAVHLRADQSITVPLGVAHYSLLMNLVAE